MGDESGRQDAEIEIDNEDVYVSRKLHGCNGSGSGTQYHVADSDPDSADHKHNYNGGNGPRPTCKFCDSPELEMPGVKE